MGNISHVDARKIEENWKGGDCDHPVLNKEYVLGAATGDFVCTKCGKSDFGRDWPDKERANRAKN